MLNVAGGAACDCGPEPGGVHQGQKPRSLGLANPWLLFFFIFPVFSPVFAPCFVFSLFFSFCFSSPFSLFFCFLAAPHFCHRLPLLFIGVHLKMAGLVLFSPFFLFFLAICHRFLLLFIGVHRTMAGLERPHPPHVLNNWGVKRFHPASGGKTRQKTTCHDIMKVPSLPTGFLSDRRLARVRLNSTGHSSVDLSPTGLVGPW